MKQYGNKGDKIKSEYYKQRRTIAKTMLNSVYGVLGLPVFRFYDVDNAESVTKTGVQLIKYAEKMGNYYYNNIINSGSKELIEIELENGTIIKKRDDEKISVKRNNQIIEILAKNIQEDDDFLI